MLSTLRHKGVAKKVAWAVIAVVVISFGILGTASRLDKTLNSAGKIFGHNISLNTYQKTYYDVMQSDMLIYGDNFRKYGARLDLEGQTWDRLILLDEAKRRGIKVSDQEVVDTIASMPFFQSEGRFDRARYEMIVQDGRGFDRKIHDFEEGIRSQLIVAKMMDQVAAPAQWSEEQLKKQYVLKNEKIKLIYALFDPLKSAKDMKVTDEEIKTYYEANKENFRKPATVNVQYAPLNYPAKATADQKAAVKKEAESLAKELKPGSDFKMIAQAHKIEVKESGSFSQAQPLLTFAWAPELVEKIFAMKQGDYSAAFETPDGWEILYLKERKESSIPSLEESKTDATKAILSSKGFAIAKTAADAALKIIQDGLKANKSFKELAQAQGATVEETPSFGRAEYIANMGLIAEFQEEALKLDPNNRLSGVITTSQGPAIIYLDSTEGIDEKQYESDKENFKQMMQAQKKNQAAIEFLSQLKLKANLQSSLDKHKAK